MSIFNAEAFLTSTIEAPLSTERLLVPAGEYNAFVEKIDVKSGTIEKGDNAGKPWARLDVTFNIDDDHVREVMLTSKVTRTHGVMLDLDENGNLDTRKGRNIRFANLLKAFGLNAAGVSPSALVGQYCKVTIGVGSYKGEATDEIKGFVKA